MINSINMRDFGIRLLLIWQEALYFGEKHALSRATERQTENDIDFHNGMYINVHLQPTERRLVARRQVGY